MKRPRLILWYVTLVPLGVVFAVMMVLETGLSLLRAAFAVFEVIAFRFELWAKYNERGQLFNCPWKKTLKQVFVENLENYK